MSGDYALHRIRFRQQLQPLRFCVPGGCSGLTTIIVSGKTLDMAQTTLPVALLHSLKKASRPCPVFPVRTAGNGLHLRSWIVKYKGAVPGKGSRILFRCHIAAAAPVLVTNTPETYPKWLL